jgi:branched-chain amino acid aminotransferase
VKGLAYVRGRVVALAEASVPLLDRGFLFGDGVFETMRVDGGRLFRLAAHMQRLRAGLRVLGMDEGVADEAEQAARLLAAESGDAVVRVSASTGIFEDLLQPMQPQVTALSRPLPIMPAERYRDGLHVVLAQHRKITTDPLAGIKHMSYLPHIHARRVAAAAGAHDALLLNQFQRVAEATTANVFARRGNTIHAPGRSEGGLDGVTRQVVLEALAAEDVVVETQLDAATLRSADEVWLTNTTGGCQPVVRIDGHTIGTGRPGAWTKRLHAHYVLEVGR